MALQSQLLRGDQELEAAAVSDPAHVTQGASGPHVIKIQQALLQLEGYVRRRQLEDELAYFEARAGNE